MAAAIENQTCPTGWREPCESMPNDRVTMPDMFVSFLAQEPQINPNYEKVKGESETWIAQLCQYDEKDYKKHVKANFSYFVSIWAREAGPVELRTICDWMNWVFERVFDFDDMFDEGCFKDDKEQASRRVADIVDVMKTESPSDTEETADPLLEVFKTVWYRVAKRSSEGARRRFVQSMVDYAEGVVGQVNVVYSAEQLEETTFLAMRRKSIGAGPCFALIEYFYGLDLPDEVFDHHSIQQLDRIAREMIVIQNDALSFPKELAGGIDQNLVALYGHNGIAPQEAYDKIDILLKARYREWYLAQADLPQWGETIDRQVQKYIRAVQDVITANMYWSFNTTRYFGKQTDQVRQTRIINIPSTLLAKNGLTPPEKKSPQSSVNGDSRSTWENDPSLTDSETMTTGSNCPSGVPNEWPDKIMRAVIRKPVNADQSLEEVPRSMNSCCMDCRS